MTSKNAVFLVALIVVLFIGGFFYIRSQQSTDSQPPVQTPQEVTSTPEIIQRQDTSVEIDAKGFSPDKVTIKSGGFVTWVNNDTQDHQVSSALHPTHLIYPPLNTIGLLKPAEDKSLTFPEKGTYKYHDHLNPQFTGSVVIE